MKLSIKNKWMFVYSVIFSLLSILFISDDISNNYWWLYSAWMIIIYVVINIGNFTYSFNYRPSIIKKVWKLVFPLIVISIVISLLIDEKYGKNSSKDDSLIVYIVTAILLLAILSPVFIANFRLAYRNDILN